MDDLFIEREPGEPFYITSRKWKKRRDKMLELRESGKTYAEIGRMAGITGQAIRYHVGHAFRDRERRKKFSDKKLIDVMAKEFMVDTIIKQTHTKFKDSQSATADTGR